MAPGENKRARTERFEELFEAHSRAILAYALRRADSADAADALSETMLVAWRRLDDVPDGPEARPWLIGVARRVLANQRRSDARRLRLGQRLRQEVAEAYGDLHTRDVPSTAIEQAMAALAERDREMLRLTAWDGLEPTEAAAVLSIRPAAARTRLHRARARLKREMEKQDARSGTDTVLDKEKT